MVAVYLRQAKESTQAVSKTLLGIHLSPKQNESKLKEIGCRASVLAGSYVSCSPTYGALSTCRARPG